MQACPRSPIRSRTGSDRGEDHLTYLYIKLLFVELIKLVIISIRIYKDIPQEKLVFTFRNFTWSHV